jgi:hypothetical protein
MDLDRARRTVAEILGERLGVDPEELMT